METQVAKLVETAWELFQKTPEDRRFMIAIAGIPGSGKTTLSHVVTASLNTLYQGQHPGSEPIAAFVPMDGYHYTRAVLSAMENPVEAHARRGAEFTFDGPSYLRLIQSLRVPLSSDTRSIHAPSFDHAVKDPKEDDIEIKPGHRIVVFEGNYLTLDKEPWSTAAGLMDQRWFVEVDFKVARARLVKRHVLAGITANEEEAGRRADESDLLNGREIVDKKIPGIDETVYSREDEKWT